MIITQIKRSRQVAAWCLALTLWIGLAGPAVWAMDVRLPTLKSGTDSFTNVTVYDKSETDIFIRHSRGFGNVKISSLDDATQILLGFKAAPTVVEAASADSSSSAAVQKMRTSLAAAHVKLPSESELLKLASQYRLTPNQLMIVAALVALAYLLYCSCLKRICLNAGSQPGFLVWLPILQIFPLLRAAQMPAWWFVIFLLPVLNVLAHILWCFRIVKACGKGSLVAVFLILPVTNVLAFLYLALSKGNESSEATGVKFDGRTASLAEA